MKTILDKIQGQIQTFIELRHAFHAYPELGLKEDRTSDVVAENLSNWGYEVSRGIARTGIVAQLKRGNSSKRLGIRADMDALPIRETTGLPYASQVDGVMHACGHDGHMTMLLASAWYLAYHGSFSGTLNLIFQPAEEDPGGAKLMIDSGLFDSYPCDAVFAMHNMPGVPQGHLVFFDGPATASSDDVTIIFRGSGGHATAPQKTNDPLIAASSVVLALQTLISRNVDPREMAVVNVGSFVSGTSNNVIPTEARLELTVRTQNSDVRTLLEKRLHELVIAQAASFGVQVNIDYRRGYPVMMTTQAETEFAREVGVELVGADQVIMHGAPVAGSEDFAFMLEQCPGSFLLIGNGHGDGACMVHNPGYDFDDRNIVIGASYWALLATRFLRS